MKGIIAVNNLGFIGYDNKLLWSNKEDLKHFKKLTEYSICLVGFTTNTGLPKLKNREIVVDDRNNINQKYDEIDWCIGGKKTYEKFCHLFTELHISHINDNKIGNVTFPNLSNLNKECKIFNYQF